MTNTKENKLQNLFRDFSEEINEQGLTVHFFHGGTTKDKISSISNYKLDIQEVTSGKTNSEGTEATIRGFVLHLRELGYKVTFELKESEELSEDTISTYYSVYAVDYSNYNFDDPGVWVGTK